MLVTDKEKLKKYASGRRVQQGIPGIARTPGGRAFISFYSDGVKRKCGAELIVGFGLRVSV